MDKSYAIENIVYNELIIKGYEVYTGKTRKGEIDFVATKPNKKIYIQVAYLLADPSVAEREFRPLLKIEDNYPKYVVSGDRHDFSRKGIIHKNIIDFLLSRGGEGA